MGMAGGLRRTGSHAAAGSNNEVRKKKSQLLPGPVHDEFLQAFIITKGRESFYLDQNGNFDNNYRKIQWSGKVSRLFVANPYLVAFLESDHNNAIEVRNIFNPTRIFYRRELPSCQFITMCVS